MAPRDEPEVVQGTVDRPMLSKICVRATGTLRRGRRRRGYTELYFAGRDSAGKIDISNFSVCRMIVSVALTPICSPTKTLCR
jgi:hypothetical protein